MVLDEVIQPDKRTGLQYLDGEVQISTDTDFTSAEQKRSLDIYQSIYRQHGDEGPQVEGLTEEELPEALLNPNIVKLIVKDNDGSRIALPLLAPVEYDAWYSDPYYSDVYPGTPAIHLINIPGADNLITQEYVQQMAPYLRMLAGAGALLPFDARDDVIDGTETRITEMLKRAGVKFAVEPLVAIFRDGKGDIYDYEPASQTYYAGKVTLKKPEFVREVPLSLKEAYSRAVSEGIYDPEANTGTAIVDEFTPAETDRLWQLYEEPFVKLSTNHPCEQGLTREQFVQFLEDTRVTKIVHRIDGEIVTLCMFSEDLSICPWVDPEFYAKAYPEEYNRNQILYFPDLVKDDERGGEVATLKVVKIIAELVEYGGNEIVVAFDCCNQNDVFLPGLLDALINRRPQSNIEIKEIGKQSYRAIKLLPTT